MEPNDFEQIYRRYAPAVFRRAFGLLGRDAEAQEAMQEVFVAALIHWEEFERRSSVMTWLYSITTNHCINRIKQDKRHAELLQENSDCIAPQDLPNPEALRSLRSLLENLSKQDAQLAVYLYLDEMSHEEIARQMGFSRRKVGYLAEKVQQRLIKIMKPT